MRDLLEAIFDQSELDHLPTNVVADALAVARIGRSASGN
jgi:hypothetical protein